MGGRFKPKSVAGMDRNTQLPVECKRYYDEDRDITLINPSGMPLVKSSPSTAEIMTKTEVKRESDDSQYNLLEQQTKSRTERESEDDHNFMLDFLTKTKMRRESDDTSDLLIFS